MKKLLLLIAIFCTLLFAFQQANAQCTAPVPTLSSLPDVTGTCSATVTAPTANANCKTVVYDIALSQLVNLPNDCSGAGHRYGNNAAGQGFNWTSTASGTVASVKVEIREGVRCYSSTLGVRLNGTDQGLSFQSASNCNCTPSSFSMHSFDLNSADYNPGGVNTFRVVNQNSWFGLSPNAGWGGAYARITVVYQTSNVVTATTTDPLTYTTKGTHEVTWTYDNNGVTSTQKQKVIITGANPVPDVASLPDVTGTCSATVSTVPTATAVCPTAVTLNGTTSDPLTYDTKGEHTITWTYNDGNGNIVTQTQKVTVINEAPVPDVASLPTLYGDGCTVTAIPPTATDDCGLIDVVYNIPVGQLINLTAACGGANPNRLVFNAAYGFNWTSLRTDNVTSIKVEISESYRNFTGSKGVTLNGVNQGLSLVSTSNANCGNGLIQTHTFMVSPSDYNSSGINTLLISGMNNWMGLYPNADWGGEYARVTVTYENNTITATTTNPLTYTVQGAHQINWKYDDGDGNITTQTQTVLITDRVITPDVASLPDLDGACSVALTAPTASQICSGSIVATTTSPMTITKEGINYVMWKYDDGAGNVKTQMQKVTITDRAIVPDVASLPDVTGNCSVTLTAPTAVQTCLGPLTGTKTGSLTITQPGTTIVTWTYNDGLGNILTQDQKVIVVNVAPVPDVANLPDITGSCPLRLRTFPTATDDCSGAITGTTTNDLSYFTVGTYQITWKFDDGDGNVTTQTQKVIVSDNVAPEPEFPELEDIVAECQYTFTKFPTAIDDCAGRVTATTTNPLTYTGVGTYTITWSYKDDYNNVSTQTQKIIIIEDNVAPIVDKLNIDTIVECSINLVAPTANDHCKGVIVGTTTQPLSYNAQGTYFITWTYNDGNGNETTQIQKVQVRDITAPVPNSASLSDITVSCNVTITDFPTATDNCDGIITATTTSPLTYTVQGTYTIAWVYRDARGNTTNQSQKVIIRDNVAPVPDLATLPDITTNCSITVTERPTATDNCKGTITGASAGSLTFTTQGTHIINWTYNDGNGNVSTQTQKVIVLDNVAPVPNVANLPDITTSCAVTISARPTATDNCKGQITATTTSPLTYSAQGTYQIEWVYADGNGNTSTQIQRVIIQDTEAPVPNVATLADFTAACSTTITIRPKATDNCAGTIIGTTTDPLTITANGTHIITWSFDDGNGNISTQTQRVIISEGSLVLSQTNLPDITATCTYLLMDAPTAFSGCTGLVSATTNDPNFYSVPGTYSINWMYNDGRGNTLTQTQKLILSAIDTSITVNGATLSISEEQAASYQWIDCISGASIPNATGPSFTANSNGNYAVVVSKLGCAVTSSCYTINNVGINNMVNFIDPTIYPNPTLNSFTLNFGVTAKRDISIRNMLGQLLINEETSEEIVTYDLTRYEPGMYFVVIATESGNKIFKVVKN
jgi:large repetitive protein